MEARSQSPLLTEALIGGRLLVVPKHSDEIELYGSLEEAEARLAVARNMLAEKGDPETAERLLLVQKALRAVMTLLADPERGRGLVPRALALLLEAARGLAEPTGWSLHGCSPEDAEMMLASTLVRRADRLVSRMAEKGLLDSESAGEASRLLSTISYVLYRLHWSLCRGGGAKKAAALVS